MSAQVAQRLILSESLDDANEFRNTGSKARYAACERALRQVTHTLERLAHVWKVRPTSDPNSTVEADARTASIAHAQDVRCHDG